MADFTVTITDDADVAGITWAREQYNSTLPKDDEGNPIDPLNTDAAYVQFVMASAAHSYATQKAMAGG
jgi:hypothetical protein